MNLYNFIKLLTFLQCLALSQSSRVQRAKQHIRTEVRSAVGPPPVHYYKHYHGPRMHRVHPPHRQRWRDRRRSIEHHHHHFTGWSEWTSCNAHCVKRRERFCKAKRKCGYTKHVEERKCWSCHAQHSAEHHPTEEHHHHTPPSIVINAAAAAASGRDQHESIIALPATAAPIYEHHEPPPPTFLPHLPPSMVDIVHPEHYYDDSGELVTPDETDFFVLRTRRKIKSENRPPPLEFEESESLESAESSYERPVPNLRNNHHHHPNFQKRPQRQHGRRERERGRARGERKLRAFQNDFGIEGDVFQYEDFDIEQESLNFNRELEENTQYNDSVEENDYGEYKNSSNHWQPSKERATNEALIPRHRRIYSKWSRWTKCSSKCTTRRYKKCRVREHCGREVLREIAYCYTEGSFCQQWLQAELQKSSSYNLRPVTASRRMHDESAITNNAVVSDYIMNGKGYRGTEYTPMKLKCGIAPIRSNKRNMYNMLKIIGGKAARKGEWPWQVAIFNRFKEAFCGGTLVAPQWILTAAHCVRKVLYVRIGEHNLDYDDGTELQLRVLKSYKHPNFDKKTVDSDVALLKLPRPVNATTWIGFSCLPRPYQPLPKNIDCTVIGWGKRRNRDIAGTSVLHQAEVPIIPMDNCRSVYHDYTITKNMFCAGHRRGRIDTCAGDSGGPLLCRDTTKPNHPWTIFGITSFGDGCAKRNKFGIYAKVTNYVDWVWSVINCNGNCKTH